MMWLRELVTRNWASKLFAVGASIALWWGFGGQRTGQEAMQPQIRFVHTPPELEINPDQLPEVDVILRGPSSRLTTLRRAGLTLVVDGSEVYGAGQHTVNVDRENLGLPSDIELVKATPSQIRYRLERSAVKEVEVVPQFVGEMQEGYMLEGYWTRPRTLRVAGPEDRVALVEAVQTDPIDLSGEVGGRTFRTTAYLSDPYLRFLDDPELTVGVRVRRR